MKHILTTLLVVITITQVIAQQELLQSGPMVGYTTMREVALWVQTTESAQVRAAYWVVGTRDTMYTRSVETQYEDAFTAHLLADKVEPGKQYDYEVHINGQRIKRPYETSFHSQSLWQWRTDPPEFTIALGSCSYVNDTPYDRPGRGYGGEYAIFDQILTHQPDLMLWLGDNMYLREADWSPRTGIQHRYTHPRSLPEMQALLGSVHNYAIWDDHDYGPNDSDRSYALKDETLKVFKDFWANPHYGLGDTKGIMGGFQYADVEFTLLDNRYHRSPNYKTSSERTMLGEEQLEWLIDRLVSSRATFKMVAIGGQVLNTAAVYENYRHLFPEERAYILRRIEEEGIKNVIFLTGDRHHTELSKLTNAAENTVYDFTVSPLTSGSGSSRDEVNRLRVDGTLVVDRNYGLIKVTGKRKERVLTLEVRSTDGKLLWTQRIEAE